jgi:type I restriction enzyme R subunit
VAELTGHIAALPTSLTDEDEEAKRFDMLMLRAQLAVLNHEPGFQSLRDHIRELVGRLEEAPACNIPMVREQLVLVQAVAGEEWWQDVTVPMLEVARRRLRSLMKFIDKTQRKTLYTDFEDTIGVEQLVALGDVPNGTNPERFRAKARQFLRQHESHITLRKVMLNQPLTASDLAELERMLLDAGVGTPEDIEQASKQSEGFGLFIRSLVGLDREAAKSALSEFLTGGATANQIEFVNLVITYLTQHGVMDAALLYESPFIDHSPHGPEGLFSPQQVERLVGVLREIRGRAAAWASFGAAPVLRRVRCARGLLKTR